MLNELLVKLDYFLLRYSYLFNNNLHNRFSIPSKRLLRHCFNNMLGDTIAGKVDSIAHMYCYDSTVDINNLSLIEACYGPITRERVRQILCKFVRKYYKEKKYGY